MCIVRSCPVNVLYRRHLRRDAGLVMIAKSMEREELLCIYTGLMCDVQKVQSMGSAAGNSMKAVPAALQYLAKVVVQDALERALREGP